MTKVKTPKYYKGKYYKHEAHEVIEDFAGDNYNIGVCLAYLMRAGKKKDNSIVQDLQKCIDHLHFEIKRQKHLQKNNIINRINNKLFNANTDSTYK